MVRGSFNFFSTLAGRRVCDFAGSAGGEARSPFCHAVTGAPVGACSADSAAAEAEAVHSGDISRCNNFLV